MVIVVAVGVALEGSGLTVDYFGLAGADTMFLPVQDKRLPSGQPPGGVFGYSDPAAAGFLNPGFEFRRSLVPIYALKQEPKAFVHIKRMVLPPENRFCCIALQGLQTYDATYLWT